MDIGLTVAAVELNIGQAGMLEVRDFQAILSETYDPRSPEAALADAQNWEQAIRKHDPDVVPEDDSTEALSVVRQYLDEHDLSQEELVERAEKYDRMTSGRPSKTAKWAERIQSGEATLSEAEEALPQSTFYKLKREYDV